MSGAAMTQAEIDDLLAALTSGDPETQEVPEAKESGSNVKPYDFRSASKFPKDQLKTMRSIFSTFAQLLANRITGSLRVPCECEVLDVEEQTFNEMNNSISGNAVIAVMSNDPLEGSQLMVLSPEMGYMIVSRALGGTITGKAVDTSKQFTEIELALLERLMNEIMKVFQEAWKKILVIKTELERTETNPQFAQIVPLNEAMAVVTISVTMGGEMGLICVGLPHSSIEPVGKQLATRFLAAGHGRRSDERMSRRITQNILNTQVTLTTYFDDTPMSVRDIMELRPGEIIPLNHRVDEPLKVRVQHVPKFKVKLGKLGGADPRYAVKLIDTIKEDTVD